MRFCSIFGSKHKRVLGKLIEKRPCLSQFERIETVLKMVSNNRHFPVNFLKVFKNYRILSL